MRSLIWIYVILFFFFVRPQLILGGKKKPKSNARRLTGVRRKREQIRCRLCVSPDRLRFRYGSAAGQWLWCHRRQGDRGSNESGSEFLIVHFAAPIPLVLTNYCYRRTSLSTFAPQHLNWRHLSMFPDQLEPLLRHSHKSAILLHAIASAIDFTTMEWARRRWLLYYYCFCSQWNSCAWWFMYSTDAS